MCISSGINKVKKDLNKAERSFKIFFDTPHLAG
jgi:hypothetical protein